MEKYKLANINWVNFLFLSLTPVLGFILAYYFFQNNSWQWSYLGIFFLFYILTGFSITAGYHRLLSHRSYLTKPWVKAFYLVFGAAAFENSALNWCTDHRRHHTKVDTSDDPYNINEGFFFAHMGWVFLKPDPKYNTPAQDLWNDPLVRWQHKYYLHLAIGVGLILPSVVGHFFLDSAFAGFLFGGLLRVVIVQHCTFFINSLCHMWGKQTYNSKNTARDNPILALFTYGEGYHNFHHKFEADFRNGIRWYHFDPTKWLILSLKQIGWAQRLIKTSDEEILKAKMSEVNNKLEGRKLSKASIDLIEQLKSQVEQSQKNWRRLKKDYEAFKREIVERKDEKIEQLRKDFDTTKREKIQQFRKELEQAKLEFRLAYSQWRACTKVLRQARV